MITLFHLRLDINHDQRLSVTWPLSDATPRAVAAANLFHEGGYQEAAKIEGNDLNYAWRATNNGALSESWSQSPPKGVRPSLPGYIEINGKRYGYKSSEVGDIFRIDETNEYFVIDSFGFTKVEL